MLDNQEDAMATKRKPKTEADGANTRLYKVLAVDTAGQLIREVGIASGAKGIDAIKTATKNPDGLTHTAGDYKAVPVGTWESEGNNLTIETEEKVVTNFITRAKSKSKANGTGVVE